jgi:Arc/MetJ-type ribon-helix-helix transcriptional regulator
MVQKAKNEVYVRTQVMLTEELTRAIDKARDTMGESRSEYLRTAAEMRLREKDTNTARRQELANRAIGSTALSSGHPHWKNKHAVESWRGKIRDEWK